VAYRTALKARARAAWRGQRERPLEDVPAAGSENPWLENEDRLILDQEIHRLPDSCRLPFVLCYLQGKTNEQAASQLGWPKGTVATRLSRARQRLRDALLRRGLTLSVAVALVSQDTLSAVVPSALLASTAQAALLGPGPAVASGCLAAEESALAKGVLKAMFMTKMKIMTAIVIGAATIGIGAGKLFYAAGGRTGSSAVTREENPEQPPARVGRIIIAGSKHTTPDVILQQVPLRPGQIITAPDLRRAEANLARLNIFEVNHESGVHPTVAVVDPEGDDRVKDLLVTVQETRGSLLFGLGVNSPASLPGRSASNQPTATATEQAAPARAEDARQPVWIGTNGVAFCADEIRLHVFGVFYFSALYEPQRKEPFESMRHAPIVLDELLERGLLVADALETLKKRPQILEKFKALAAKDCDRFLLSDMGKAMVKFQQAQGIELEELRRWREHVFLAEEYKRHLFYPLCETIGRDEVAQYYQQHADQFLSRSFGEAPQAEIRAQLQQERLEREYRKWLEARKRQAAAATRQADLTDLPAGSLLLAGNDAKVFATSQVDGKLTLQMEGHGQATVTAAELHGTADVIKYDEENGLIVLQADASNLATLRRSNGAASEIRGRKIYYWIHTGALKIEGGTPGM